MALSVAVVVVATSRLTRLRGDRPFRIVEQQDLVSLDPGLLAFGNISILSNVFEGLVCQDRDLRIQPALAVNWATVDERIWTFELRKGVHFHDGSLFTAADVKTAFDRARNDADAAGKQQLATIESLEVTGELSLRVTTRGPDALLLQRLSMHRVAKGATTQRVTANPVGTGPYRFVRWERGRRIELTAFEGYWGAVPLVRHVELVALPQPARIKALERGEVDLAPISPDMALEPNARPPLQLLRGPSLSRMFLWLGGLPRDAVKNPLADRRVRRAVALALDRRALSGSLVADSRMAAFQLVPKTLFGYAPDIAEPSQDRGGALRLLAEAGFSDGFEAPMIHGSYPLAAKTAIAVSDMLRAVGIRTNPRAATDEAVLAAALGGQAAGFVVEQWTYDDGDAGSFLRDCVHSHDPARGKGVFNPGFSDAAMDRLIDEALAIPNDSDRLNRYHEIMRVAMEAVPTVPLFDRPYVYGLAAGVQWKPRADGFILAAEIKPAR